MYIYYLYLHINIYVYITSHHINIYNTQHRTLKCRVPTSVLCAFPGTRASAEPQSTKLCCAFRIEFTLGCVCVYMLNKLMVFHEFNRGTDRPPFVVCLNFDQFPHTPQRPARAVDEHVLVLHVPVHE